jgi:hypothetical protein
VTAVAPVPAVAVLYTNRPVAGLEIGLEVLAVEANSTLGGKNPLVVLLTSSCAEAFGLVVPTPTCAFVNVIANNKRQVAKIDLKVVFILIGFDSFEGYTKI